MNFDFAAFLVLLTFVSGAIWLFDSLFLAKSRNEKSEQGATIADPWPVEFAKSFFPIFLIVLILRSFIVEPFRIPSASMMPTLLIGDFILVNKYDYGIRLPVLNTKVYGDHTPERGDIVVFRYPEDDKTPYIKRVIGLPGDELVYEDKTLYINGEEVKETHLGDYTGQDSDNLAMFGSQTYAEDLTGVTHRILEVPGRTPKNISVIVPKGHYFVLGDNRDNSKDSRYWGFVPDENLMGRAFMIWMNWRSNRFLDLTSWRVDWKRIGTMLH